MDCYVLQANSTKAELITVDIYDQRFGSTYNYAESELSSYMDKFYNEKEGLSCDPYILETEVTYRFSDIYRDDLSTYNTGTVIQGAFALDAVEAQANASKFSWDPSDKMGGNGAAFWVAAGCDLTVWSVVCDGVFIDGGVDVPNVGARPAFWISLTD